MAGAGVVGLAGFLGYAAEYEPNLLSVNQVEVRLKRLPEAFEGLRIAQISDLHHGPYTGEREIGAAVRAVNGLRPDLIAVTGDFITVTGLEYLRPHADHIVPCAKLLSSLQAPLGVLAVLGNHDQSSSPAHITAVLANAGVQVLRNRSSVLEKDGARLWVAGVDDVMHRGADLDRALNGVPADECTILMAHEPDFADRAATTTVDFQLSGHSHGGQVKLPGGYPIYLPPLARKYPEGLRRVRSMQVYTNRGIGVIGVPMRVNCSPEVTVFTLKRA